MSAVTQPNCDCGCFCHVHLVLHNDTFCYTLLMCLQSGNPYGVSVFVDEYAQWGDKLGGKMTLGETVSKKMTSYF